MSTFSIESFAAGCKEAMKQASDPQTAAAHYLRQAMAEHGPDAIIASLQAAVPPGASVGELIVHASPELTMLFGRIPPRFQSGIHDHTVFACIGQLTGEEINTFYEPAPEGGLKELRSITARPGEVIELPADVVHGIANPGDETAFALHLYGGDFGTLSDERSLWDAESHERKGFSFPGLVQESVKTMHKGGNRAGLEAVAKAIPAVRATIESLSDGSGA